MIALDTNVLIYACDRSDPQRQQTAIQLVASSTDGVMLWQVACASSWPRRGTVGVEILYSEEMPSLDAVDRFRVVNPFAKV